MKSLVSAEWLASQIDNPDLLVLDASKHLPGAQRDEAAEFDAAHIPTALFLDLASLVDQNSAIPNALPTAAQFSGRMSALGLTRDHRIVLYDDSQLRSSARAWFLFRMMVAPDTPPPVAILDGGLKAWRDGGFDLASGPAPVTPSNFVADRENRACVRGKTQIITNCQTRAEQVVDARDAARFTGEVDDAVHGLAGGHIPGARNVFFRDLLAEDGTFRSRDRLRAIFEEAGVDMDRPIVASCGSGMTASVLTFALHLIGHQDAALYDGSWSEWGADPETPKETGNAA